MGNSSRVLSNLIWRFMERCGAQVVSFIVSLVLARILDPEVYGIVAITIAFSTILQVFIDSGLGNALVQKKDADEVDFSSVFYFNAILCIFLYIIVFIASPYVAIFYNNNDLTLLIRVISLTILVSGVKNIQQAYVTKHLLFKKFFYSTLIGTVISAVVGIIAAYNGAGVWALIAQNLTNQIIDTLILWITVKWRPTAKPSFNRLKQLLPFGVKIFISSMTNTIYGEIRELAIGKKYTSSDLAFYNRGQQFPYLIVANINTSIDSVLFPVLSEEQNELDKVKSMTKEAITIGNYILAPLLLGLAAVAEPLVKLILTEKWLFCVPYLRIFCLIYVFQPMHTANKNAIKALGKSDILIKQEIINDIVGIAVLFIALNKGVMAITIGYLLSTTFNLIINCWPNGKLINYSFFNQMVDILPSTILAIVMFVAVYFVSTLGISLVIQILIGIVVYIAGSLIFKIEPFSKTVLIVKNLLKRN